MDFGWVEQHLLPCPFKAITGMDCPGCGFQRSLLMLVRGDFLSSFYQYPALLPILFTFAFLLLHLKYRFAKGAKILVGLYIFAAAVVLTSFFVKQFFLFHHS